MNPTNPQRDPAIDRDTNPNNRDPITGAPGAHPVSVGVGATGGGAIGAAIGAAGGPVGAAVGAGIGAVVGGLAGKAIAEEIDPSVEDAYWRETYTTRDYVRPGVPYPDYAPAYRYGWESAATNRDRDFADLESDLERDWDRRKANSQLAWHDARYAVRDAWNRVRQPK
jgi:hypothetical protein